MNPDDFEQRDLIALIALHGILSCPETRGTIRELSEEAFLYANAFLKARKEVTT